MKSNTILLVTHSHDHNCVDIVKSLCEKSGFRVVRLNTDLFPVSVKLDSIKGLESYHVLTTELGESVTSQDVCGVWYRRFFVGKSLPNLDRQIRKVCLDESKAQMLGFLSTLNCFKIDDYWNIRRADCKELQLSLARESGLTVPETLTTNNPKSVLDFYNKYNGNIITKTQTSFLLYEDGKESVVYTNKVNEEDLDKLDGLAYSPMVFQESIDKKLELRATVVGDEVYCIAIDSRKHRDMKDDWRKKGSTTLDEWFTFELPSDIKTRLLQLAKRLELHYGAADIILTPDGEYIFLEINPCGEFFWADKHVEAGISEAIARLLIKNSMCAN